MDGSNVITLLALGTVSVLGIVVIGIGWWLLSAYASYGLAKREGYGEIAWFLFLPVLGDYVRGSIASVTAPRRLRGYLGILLASNAVLLFVTPLFIVSYGVLFGYVAFLTYRRYSEHAILLMVVTLFSGFLAYPFILLQIRKNDARDTLGMDIDLEYALNDRGVDDGSMVSKYVNEEDEKK